MKYLWLLCFLFSQAAWPDCVRTIPKNFFNGLMFFKNQATDRLFDIAARSSFQEIQSAIDHCPKLIKARGKHNSTLLHYAALNNNDPAVITFIVRAGADPRASNKKDQSLVTGIANKRGKQPIINLSEQK